jgi:hypothetical protein
MVLYKCYKYPPLCFISLFGINLLFIFVFQFRHDFFSFKPPILQEWVVYGLVFGVINMLVYMIGLHTPFAKIGGTFLVLFFVSIIIASEAFLNAYFALKTTDAEINKHTMVASSNVGMKLNLNFASKNNTPTWFYFIHGSLYLLPFASYLWSRKSNKKSIS